MRVPDSASLALAPNAFCARWLAGFKMAACVGARALTSLRRRFCCPGRRWLSEHRRWCHSRGPGSFQSCVFSAAAAAAAASDDFTEWDGWLWGRLASLHLLLILIEDSKYFVPVFLCVKKVRCVQPWRFRHDTLLPCVSRTDRVLCVRVFLDVLLLGVCLKLNKNSVLVWTTVFSVHSNMPLLKAFRARGEPWQCVLRDCSARTWWWAGLCLCYLLWGYLCGVTLRWCRIGEGHTAWDLSACLEAASPMACAVLRHLSPGAASVVTRMFLWQSVEKLCPDWRSKRFVFVSWCTADGHIRAIMVSRHGRARLSRHQAGV